MILIRLRSCLPASVYPLRFRPREHHKSLPDGQIWPTGQVEHPDLYRGNLSDVAIHMDTDSCLAEEGQVLWRSGLVHNAL